MLRCRSGKNNCLVTKETRKCANCRYDKCIKAGMKVLPIVFLMLLLILVPAGQKYIDNDKADDAMLQLIF